MNLPYHALAFDKNTDISEVLKPLAPKRFDVTFNKTCKPEQNTICYYAKLADNLSVFEEEATRHNIKIEISRIYRDSVESHFGERLIAGYKAQLILDKCPLVPLTAAELDSVAGRQMNALTLHVPEGYGNFSLYGHSIVKREYKEGKSLNIPAAMIMFGAMESLSLVLSKKFRSSLGLAVAHLTSLLNHVAKSMLSTTNWQGFELDLSYFELDQNKIHLIIQIKHPMVIAVIPFGFTINIYSDCTSVTFGDLDDVELYKNCFVGEAN